MYCADCESVDEYFFDSTWFWIFVPTVESFGKVARICGSLDVESKQETTHCISTNIPAGSISRFLTSLNGALEGPELAGTKVTTSSQYEEFDLHVVGRMTTLEILVNRYKSKWLIESVAEERFETWFQPIVKIGKDIGSYTTFAHEGLFRIRDDKGTIVPPNLAFSLAEQSDLLFSLDLVARRSAVECAAKARLRGKLFINFNPSSIYDPAYCLRATAASINEIGLKPEDVVFEITETHKATDLNHLKGILAFYRNAGFQVALDDIGSGWSGLNLLHSLRPDYVKIDMELVRDIHIDVYKQNIVTNLINIARTNGIAVIAEGVENELEAQWLGNARADYLQGYLFGKPASLSEKVDDRQADAIAKSVAPLRQASSI
eukprot:TRINITY_DN846_c0_g1_i2.p1 TRINITY_DN846_c0_g1~~TRINITY_DN846_c0_g1_i2.p1  ORF type:complete len:376 (-),score=53.22 TRINITY_DN846_c0_g1_i2:596-1723(-)